VRAKAAVSMVAWVAMMGGKPGEGSYDLRLGDGRRYRLRPAIPLFRINVWSMGVLTGSILICGSSGGQTRKPSSEGTGDQVCSFQQSAIITSHL
jgi:hypothetical protein